MARNVTVGIAANCDNVLTFLFVVAIKAPQVVEVPLLLRADKRSTRWFRQWLDSNLEHHRTPHKTVLQDHSGLKGVLSEVATRLQNVGDLRPVVASQCNTDMETSGWDRLPLKS